jgi:DNA polymerase-3 subunit gamma/tau
MPQHSRYRIYIIDEVHMLSLAAFNALLKTIEEPPSHVLFFFATTESQKIPITILSRCQRHDLKRIGITEIASHMADLCSRENISVPGESLELMARESGGCMRDALSLLDQVISCSEGPVDHNHVLDILGVVDRDVVFAVTSAIFRKDIPDILEILDEIYGRGHDIRKFYADLIEHVRNLMVVKSGKRVSRLVDVPTREIDLMKEQVKPVSETYLSQILDMLFKEESGIRFSSNPRVAMEMACIKMAQIKPALPIETLIEKLDTLKKKTDFKNESHDGPVAHPPEDCGEGQQDPAVTAVPRDRESPVSRHHEGEGDVWDVIKDNIGGKFPSLSVPISKTTFELTGDKGVLLTVTGTDFDAKMVERKKDDIESIIQGVIKKPVRVEIKSNVNQDNRKEIKRAGRVKEGAINHPLVADAVEIFDGRIVDIKIL